MYDWDGDVLAFERARELSILDMDPVPSVILADGGLDVQVDESGDVLTLDGEADLSPEIFRETVKLTFSEADLVLFGAGDPGDEDAGDGDATEVEEVVVVGRRVIVAGIPFMTWGDPSGGGGGGGGPGDGGGGGLGPDPDTGGLTPYDSLCGATGAIRDAINGIPTNNTNEHVAIVFRGADGRLYVSPPFTGTAGNVDFQQLATWMDARGIGINNVVGIYHNHPTTSSTNPDPDLHRYPSNQNTVAPGAGHDWMVADAFVNGGADRSHFVMFIEDQDGNVRSFSYSDRGRYANMTRQEMEDAQDLPGVTNGCGSGS